ncbi:MAG TPA: acyl-CoA thioesterase II [Acidimicrobiales bacterium]|nr:acyl-CoA thioesterase II [Acidimicrobiales bacterium]
MSEGIASFLNLLDLETIEVNIFRGQNLGGRARVFGGQVAAQALIAAGRTVEQGRVHSLHAYFLRAGDPGVPILYEVDRIRDGRSFATRRVVAIQRGRAIFNAAYSFHVDEPGLIHQNPMTDIPVPDDLPVLEIPDDRRYGPALSYLEGNGFDIRFVGEAPWRARPGSIEREQLWFRATEALADDPLLHTAIMTFVSDLTLVSTILLRHGLSLFDTEFFGASLDHCMWFHRPFRVDDWIFYDLNSPVAYGARGLSHGSLYAKNGDLAASVAQEGLVRIEEPNQ